VTRLLGVALLTAAAVRVLASLVSGVVTAASVNDYTPPGTPRTGQVLSAFGSAGDTIEALLLFAALVVLWRELAELTSSSRTWLTVLVVATAALVVCRVAGVFTFTWGFSLGPAAAQQAEAAGFGVADLVVCVAILYAVPLASRDLGDEATDDQHQEAGHRDGCPLQNPMRT